MSPDREGDEVGQFRPPRPTEIPWQVSIRGRTVFGHAQMRPIVAERDVATTGRYANIGLSPPGANSAFLFPASTGDVTGDLALFVARHDSARGIYSDLESIVPERVRNESTDPLVIFDTDTSDLKIGDGGLRLRWGIFTPNLGSEFLVSSYSIGSMSLKMKRAAGPVTGTITVELSGRKSEPLDAAVLTDTYVEHTFIFTDPVIRPVSGSTSGVYLVIEWSGATIAAQTDHVLVAGFLENVASPIVIDGATTPTPGQIANNIFGLGESGSLSRLASVARAERTYDIGANESIGFITRVQRADATAARFAAWVSQRNSGDVWLSTTISSNSFPVANTINANEVHRVRAATTVPTSTYLSIAIPLSGDLGASTGDTVYVFNSSGGKWFLSGKVASSTSSSVTIGGTLGGTWLWFPVDVWDDGYVVQKNISTFTPASEKKVERENPANTYSEYANGIYLVLRDVSFIRDVDNSKNISLSGNEFGFAPYLLSFEKGGVEIGGLQSALGDHETDQYDSLAIIAYDVFGNEFYVVEKLPLDTDTYNFTSYNPEGATIYAPLQWKVPPATRTAKTISVGADTRLYMAGQIGFDSFIDMPRLDFFSPTVRITEDGVLTSGQPLHAYRDGTYIAIGYDAFNNELIRAYIHGSGDSGDPDHTGTGVGAVALTANQIQLCRDFERASVFASDQDVSGNFTAQRWEIRRQIVAHATRNQKEVRLSYDAAGSAPAKVAEQFWVAHTFVIQDVSAPAVYIKKVHTVGGDYIGSLDDGETTGTGFILEQPWGGPTTSGFLVVAPEAKSMWVTKAGINSWQSLGEGYKMDFATSLPIQALEVIGDNAVVITEANDLFAVSPSGFIADPIDFFQALTFDIRLYLTDERFTHPFTCVSRATWVAPNRRIGFIGSEGPSFFDFNQVRNLLDMKQRTTWGEYDKKSLGRAVAAVDPQHPYAMAVRIAGMQDKDGFKGNQLVYLPERHAWLNFTGQCNEFTTMATISMVNGSSRIMFGANGRLYLYATPSRADSNSPPDDIYLFPYVGGTQYGTVTGVEHDSSPALVDSTAQFQNLGEGYTFIDSHIRVAKVRDDGVIEWATVTSRYSFTTLMVTPDDGWEFLAGRTYSYIVGAIPVEIELPQITPTRGMADVTIEGFKFDMTDESQFNWPFEVKFEGTTETPNDVPSVTETIPYTKGNIVPTWAEELLCIGPDRAITVTMSGIRPPDGNMTIRFLDFTVRMES